MTSTGTIKVILEGERATAIAPFPASFLVIVASLSGRKFWNGSKSVSFDASPINLKRLNECELMINYEDHSQRIEQLRELEGLATQHSIVPDIQTPYKPKVPWFPHQKKAVNLSAHRTSYAYLLEMGLGKTAIAIANAGLLFKEKKVSGVLVLAPKGVHHQWVTEQIPEHLDPTIQVNAVAWRKRPIELKTLNKKGCLNFFTINIDAIRTPDGRDLAYDFLKLHNGKSMMIIDESHLIKNGTAIRTRNAWNLGKLATYRRILTGTPIARNILDAWSQFMFLNPDILGHKYLGTFKARYTILGGWENKQVVGQRNTEEFYKLIAPHSFRLTKAEALNLPPKVYSIREYEMDDVTERHYKSLKKTYMTALDNGDIVDVKNAAEAILRLQQIICGYLPIGEGRVEHISDDRINVLMDIIEQISGKVIVWARFTEDIKRIERFLTKAYGNGTVATYYGATTAKDREKAKDNFTKGDVRFFVSNPAAGGTGLNLQGACTDVIYYSNSFDALHRWQSEDRTHRMGTTGTVNYYDLVATRTVDKSILDNLRKKKSISDLTLDQIRNAIATA